MGFLKKIGKFYPQYSAFLGGGGGKDPGKGQQKGILKEHEKTAMQNRALYAQAAYQQRQGLGAINAGFKQANSVLGQQAANAKQGILDRETQNLGALKAGAAAGGTLGTSTNTNLNRAVYSDTSRALADTDATIGAIKAQLATQQAAAQAGQYGQLAGIAQNQAGASNQLGQSLINSLGNVQYQDPNAWLQSLFSIGGTALGAYFGGPAGAAVGGQVGSSLGGGSAQGGGSGGIY